DRLNDLREEVGKQLGHLARQARQAEQYTAIQEERRVRDAEWKALEYRALDVKLSALREGLSQEETRLQQLIAEQREAERALEEGRVKREEAMEALNRAQAAGYEVGGTLARIEQQIAHQRERSQRLLRAREEAEEATAELAQHISGDEERLAILEEQVAESEPALEALRESDESRQDVLREAEAALADWQERWDAHSREAGEAARAAEVERTRVDYLDRQSLESSRRREALSAERAGLDLEALAEAFAGVAEEHETQKIAL